MQIKRITNLTFGLCTVAFAVILSDCSSKRFSRELSETPASGIDTLKNGNRSVSGDNFANPDIITRLYEKNGDLLSPEWNSEKKIAQLISAIRNASRDGLQPEDYHLSEIDELTRKIVSSDKTDADDIVRLKSLLTDSFMALASHLAQGKTDPGTVDPEWKAPRRSTGTDWAGFIENTIHNGDISESLHNLAPGCPEYDELKQALGLYLKLAEKGGWNNFSTSMPKLELGMRHPDVVLLRKRLAVTQTLTDCDPGNEDLFDEALRDQVIIFQHLNGLSEDGVVGKSTIEALNIPVEERIKTIEANLERWRWISENLGDRYITVNIADFELQLIENGKPVFLSAAIVGKLLKETPVFSSVMKYLVINPVWVIPPGILWEEIIPEVIRNPNYLAEKNMRILQKDGTEVDPGTIDWQNIPAGRFQYTVCQMPGKNNPLGHIKFVFQNQYHIYIHDTPSRGLFSRSDRSFSHGCIRIEKAEELASYLLKGSPGWTSDEIQKAIEKGTEKIIALPEPIPVHILYLTAWVDNDGKIHFGKDIYNRDRKLISALEQAPPVHGI